MGYDSYQYLVSGKMRYNKLKKAIQGINTRMLVKTLNELESKKIVKIKAHTTVPPTVEYSLTDKAANQNLRFLLLTRER